MMHELISSNFHVIGHKHEKNEQLLFLRRQTGVQFSAVRRNAFRVKPE